MKTCPNCGSILADNEPYCENCSFDPDFDMGSWNRGYGKTVKKPYYHGNPIKKSEPYLFNKELESAICIVAWIIVAVLIVIYIFN